jgi:hypothetical protein
MNNKIIFSEALDAILRATPGDELEFFCDGDVMNQLKSEVKGIKWVQRDMGHFVVTVPENAARSSRAVINEIMDNYQGGLQKLDIPDSTARVYVHNYNRANKTEYKIKTILGELFLYCDDAKRRFLSIDQYQEILNKCLAEINDARRRVRENSFFEMLKPDYDNGLDPMTAEDLDIAPIPDGGFATAQKWNWQVNESPNISKTCRVCEEEFLTGDPDEKRCEVCR